MSNDSGNTGNQPVNTTTPYDTTPYGTNEVRPPKRGNAAIVVILLTVFATLGIVVICCGALLLPAILQARESARKMSCSSNLRQIGIALATYEQAFGSYPPAYTVDSDGNRLHSWRTLLLPFLDQKRLYDSIDLEKPWNDPANAAALNTQLALYRCPSSTGDKNLTSYVIVEDPTGVFSGPNPTRISAISDGLSNTVLVVEHSANSDILWMEPRDLTTDEFISMATQRAGLSMHAGGFHVVFGDSSVRFIAQEELDVETLQSFVTASDSEVINLPDDESLE